MTALQGLVHTVQIVYTFFVSHRFLAVRWKVDQFQDVHENGGRELVKIAQLRPDLKPLFGPATFPSNLDLPEHAYADREKLAYPMHTKEHTVLSKLFAQKHAASAEVVERIDNALSNYGVDPQQVTLPRQKKASAGVRYLLPQYQRLPVSDRDSIKTAAQALVRDKERLRVPTMASACTRLIKIAGEYGVEIDDLPLEVYQNAGMTQCDRDKLAQWLDARANATMDPVGGEMFRKMAQSVRLKSPIDQDFNDRDTLTKLAAAITQADEKFGLTHHYHRTLPSSMETVFNTTKLAGTMVDLGSEQVLLRDMMKIPAQVYEDLIGEDVSEAMTSPQDFKYMIETLPADMRSRMHRQLKPYLSR